MHESECLWVSQGNSWCFWISVSSLSTSLYFGHVSMRSGHEVERKQKGTVVRREMDMLGETLLGKYNTDVFVRTPHLCAFLVRSSCFLLDLLTVTFPHMAWPFVFTSSVRVQIQLPFQPYPYHTHTHTHPALILHGIDSTWSILTWRVGCISMMGITPSTTRCCTGLTVKVISEQWTYCHVQEIILRWALWHGG